MHISIDVYCIHNIQIHMGRHMGVLRAQSCMEMMYTQMCTYFYVCIYTYVHIARGTEIIMERSETYRCSRERTDVVLTSHVGACMPLGRPLCVCRLGQRACMVGHPFQCCGQVCIHFRMPQSGIRSAHAGEQMRVQPQCRGMQGQHHARQLLWFLEP